MATELQHIDLNEWTLVSERAISRSYVSADGLQLAKFTSTCEGTRPALEQEFRRSSAVAGLGIPTPQVYGLVQTDTGEVGIVYQNIVGKVSLARGIANNPQNYQEYLQKYARVMDIVHSTECNVDEFSYIGDEVRAAAAQIPVLTDYHLQKINEFLDALPHVTTCIHGDGHLGNVITAPAGDYAIDLDAFAYGSPLFDEAFLYCFLERIEDEGLENTMHFSRDVAHTCWDYWCAEIKGITTTAEKRAYEESLLPYIFCQCVKHAAGKPKAYDNVIMFMDDCRLF